MNESIEGESIIESIEFEGIESIPLQNRMRETRRRVRVSEIINNTTINHSLPARNLVFPAGRTEVNQLHYSESHFVVVVVVVVV
jgi:hypothetical protein